MYVVCSLFHLILITMLTSLNILKRIIFLLQKLDGEKENYN